MNPVDILDVGLDRQIKQEVVGSVLMGHLMKGRVEQRRVPGGDWVVDGRSRREGMMMPIVTPLVQESRAPIIIS